MKQWRKRPKNDHDAGNFFKLFLVVKSERSEIWMLRTMCCEKWKVLWIAIVSLGDHCAFERHGRLIDKPYLNDFEERVTGVSVSLEGQKWPEDLLKILSNDEEVGNRGTGERKHGHVVERQNPFSTSSCQSWPSSSWQATIASNTKTSSSDFHQPVPESHSLAFGTVHKFC